MISDLKTEEIHTVTTNDNEKKEEPNVGAIIGDIVLTSLIVIVGLSILFLPLIFLIISNVFALDTFNEGYFISNIFIIFLILGSFFILGFILTQNPIFIFLGSTYIFGSVFGGFFINYDGFINKTSERYMTPTQLSLHKDNHCVWERIINSIEKGYTLTRGDVLNIRETCLEKEIVLQEEIKRLKQAKKQKEMFSKQKEMLR